MWGTRRISAIEESNLNSKYTKVSSTDSPYDVNVYDRYILADTDSGDMIINLLNAALSNDERQILIKKIDGSNILTVVPYGTNTVDYSEVHEITGVGEINLMSDGSNWSIITQSQDNFSNGFIDSRLDSTILAETVNVNDLKFTLTFTENTQISVNQMKTFKSGDIETLTITPTTTGLYVVYYDENFDLQNKLVVSIISELEDLILGKNALIAYIYWNNTTKTVVGTYDERHSGKKMSPFTHLYLHETAGTAFGRGLGLTATVLTATDDGCRGFIDYGTIYDEDLKLRIQNSDLESGVVETDLLAQSLGDLVSVYAKLPVWYLDGSIWTYNENSGRYLFLPGTTYPYYNENLGGGSFQLTEVPSGGFVVYWIVYTNEIVNPVILMMCQGYVGTLEEAQSILFSDMTTSNIPSQEILVGYKLIIRCKSAFGGTYSSRIEEIVDLRSSGLNNTITSVVPSAHSALDGLTFTTSGHTGYQKQTYMEASNPDVDDDVDSGYLITDQWFNYSTDVMYICEDNSSGAAVWTILTSGSTGITDHSALSSLSFATSSHTGFQKQVYIRTVDPTTNNDSGGGYLTTDQWFNSASNALFVCEDDTQGSAVWTSISLASLYSGDFSSDYDSTNLTLLHEYNNDAYDLVFPRNSGIMRGRGFVDYAAFDALIFQNVNDFTTENNIIAYGRNTQPWTTPIHYYQQTASTDPVDIWGVNSQWINTSNTTSPYSITGGVDTFRGWRMFIDGDEFKINNSSKSTNRDIVNTNLMTIDGDTRYMTVPGIKDNLVSSTYTTNKICMANVSTGELGIIDNLTAISNNNYKIVCTGNYGTIAKLDNIYMVGTGNRWTHNSMTNTTYNDTTGATKCWMGVWNESNSHVMMTDTRPSTGGEDLQMDTDGSIYVISSSTRYKSIMDEDFTLTDDQIEAFMLIKEKKYNYFNDTENNGPVSDNYFSVSFIAEDLHDAGFPYLINYKYIKEIDLIPQLERKNIDLTTYLSKYSQGDKIVDEPVAGVEKIDGEEPTAPTKYYLLPNSLNKRNIDAFQTIMIKTLWVEKNVMGSEITELKSGQTNMNIHMNEMNNRLTALENP